VPLITVKIPPLPEPLRIDVALTQADLGLSRSHLKRLFGEKRITMNDKWVRVSQLVVGGEEIVIDKPDEKRIEFLSEKIDLEIVYEDDFLAVVNKPAGMVTHPAPGHESGTLANALLHHFTQLSSGYVRGFPGLVHRLDKNTSGLMVVAKNDVVHRKLADQLMKRTLTREYWALIWGKMNPPAGSIDIAIGRSRADRRVMTSGSPNTREAVTHYETMEELSFLSLVRLHLETGRTHQIRTHLKESNHPVFGDPEYTGREGRLTGIEARHRPTATRMLKMCPRQMLHAKRLEFIHPESGTLATFEIDLPQDFRQVLDVIRQYR
jgi:23S rRNA pseudouridine1911/1915/1917 synthase